MGRLENRILKLNDDLERLRRQRELIAEELRFHQHLNDDAQRDAAVSESPLDRSDARATASDVVRFERSLSDVDDRLDRLAAKRDKLLERLT
ncbi:MAG: hypothetical protein OES13_05390 [Acidimicrobiia bacterium]|nr:hypothetical protein [Acidimicrobiia bacterium]